MLGPALEARELEVSGMLFPAERRILVRAEEPEPRQRFTIAHQRGHWTCQCLGRTAQPVAVSSSAIAWRLYNVGLLAEQPA